MCVCVCVCVCVYSTFILVVLIYFPQQITNRQLTNIFYAKNLASL